MRRLRISEKLSIVIPLYETISDEKDGKVERIYAYAHSTPISRGVFEAHFELVSKAFAEIYTGGFGVAAGPRISAMLLRKIAKDTGREDEAMTLLNEIRRLTNIVIATNDGWETVPFHEAVEKDMLDEEDASEVENAVCFFTVASSMHKKQDRETIARGAGKLWGAQISSLNFTDFTASLKTSTKAVASGANPKLVSSVPY